MQECCICFESKPIKKCCYSDHVKHIPCTCNMYTHYTCLKKADTISCIICKKKYKVKWDNNSLDLFTKIKKIKDFNIKKYRENYTFRNFCHLIKALFSCICFFFIFFSVVLMSGYLCNIIYCAFNRGNKSCTLVKPDQPILYIFGVVTAPFFLCCFNFFLMCVKSCFFNYNTVPRILPLLNNIS